jgi:hypothetical protein
VSACFFCFVSGSNLACTLPRYTAVIRDEITAKWESHLTHLVDNIILLLSELSFLTKYLSTHPSATISADSALFPSRRLDRCTYSFFFIPIFTIASPRVSPLGSLRRSVQAFLPSLFPLLPSPPLPIPPPTSSLYKMTQPCTSRTLPLSRVTRSLSGERVSREDRRWR